MTMVDKLYLHSNRYNIILLQMQLTKIIKKICINHKFFNKLIAMQSSSEDQGDTGDTANPAESEHDSTRKEEEHHLWRKCNELFHSDKRLTKFYITSLIIHCAVLVFVTLSVSN